MGVYIGIGNTIGIGRSGSSWAPLTLVVEDAAPTHVVMTGGIVNTNAIASDFTIAGFTVSSLYRDGTNKILTLTLSTSILAYDTLVVIYKGVSYSVTNNVTYKQIGNIITDTFARAALGANWLESTPATTVALDGSKLVWSFTAGAGNYNEYVVFNRVLPLERWECEIIFKPSLKSGTSAGMCIRWESIDVDAAQNFDMSIQLNCGSHATYGGLIYILDNANAALIYQTAGKVTITAGHSYKLRAKRTKDLIEVYAENLTDHSTVTGSFNYPNTYPQTTWLPNIGKLGFQTVRSNDNMNYEVSSCIINSDAISNPKTMVLGDSITQGIYVGATQTDRYFSKVWGTANTKYSCFGSGGLNIAEVVTNLADIIYYKPKYLFCIIGVNDFAVNHATWQASYESFLNSLQAANIIPVIGHVLPTNNSDIRWMNTIIDSICAARSIKVVDTFTPLVSGASGLNAAYNCGDNLHINAAGHTVIANTILAAAPELI